MIGAHGFPELEPYWRTFFEVPSVSWEGATNQHVPVTGAEEVWRPCDDEEVRANYPRRAAAAGPDGISPSQWRQAPTLVLRTVFNLILYRGAMPEYFLGARTTLIPKTLEPATPADYRPITVASVLVRNLHKMTCAHTVNIVLYSVFFLKFILVLVNFSWK